MEIKDEYELNALNKLLSKIKFNDDLDFNEFKEFVGSPIIANIFQRISDELIPIYKQKGWIKDANFNKFHFDDRVGFVIKKRIDELTGQEKNTLLKNNSVDEYLYTLIKPLEVSQAEFDKLKIYFIESKTRI